jgi:hypothetical protein
LAHGIPQIAVYDERIIEKNLAGLCEPLLTEEWLGFLLVHALSAASVVA